jgi:hypothetical protein
MTSHLERRVARLECGEQGNFAIGLGDRLERALERLKAGETSTPQGAGRRSKKGQPGLQAKLEARRPVSEFEIQLSQRLDRALKRLAGESPGASEPRN